MTMLADISRDGFKESDIKQTVKEAHQKILYMYYALAGAGRDEIMEDVVATEGLFGTISDIADLLGHVCDWYEKPVAKSD